MSQGAAGRENLPSFSVTSSSLTGFNNSDPESSKDTGWLQASHPSSSGWFFPQVSIWQLLIIQAQFMYHLLTSDQPNQGTPTTLSYAPYHYSVLSSGINLKVDFPPRLMVYLPPRWVEWAGQLHSPWCHQSSRECLVHDRLSNTASEMDESPPLPGKFHQEAWEERLWTIPFFSLLPSTLTPLQASHP